MPLLREMGFGGSDAEALARAWREDPFYATAACSASAMWAANAATVTPSADSGDGRVWFTPANLISNLHRSLEREQTYAALKRLFPDEGRFAVETPLPRSPHLADEGGPTTCAFGRTGRARRQSVRLWPQGRRALAVGASRAPDP
jgi:succinylarginine dihydrolase